MTQNDFLFRGELTELDPDVAELIRHETARQQQYLILIPSESTIPEAVREAVGSAFNNVYAEGYPLEETRTMSQQDILDYNARLSEYRRIADNRYYKGTEYANIVESLARRRAAEVFAANGYEADNLYVNVQPLSGAPANNAVYTALVNLGDTVMGMDLIMGGHLTHGSPVNRSGKFYNIVSYTINPQTEQLDYDEIRALALEHKPRLIIGGFSSYPWAPDWQKFRSIADEVGAYLLADIAHFAGMTAAGEYPSPVGIADVVSFTTHKTLNGPRGAVIITHRKDLASKIDRGVFPGEQGGPHVNSIAGLAVALRLATTDQFKHLQQQLVKNAVRFAERLSARGFKIPYGGTDTHMFSLDCKSIVGSDGTTLSGDMAARILDFAGIVVNRQTIPGDTSALRPSGLRLGTPWITQRGFREAEVDQLADIIADVLQGCVPFSLTGRTRALERTKVDFDVLHQARLKVRQLATQAGIDTAVKVDGYPHFDYIDNEPDGWQTLAILGDKAQAFLDAVLTSDVNSLKSGKQQPTWILEKDGSPMSRGVLQRVDGGYHLHVERQSKRVVSWLRGLSDGFVLFDETDVYGKVPGPVDVQQTGVANTANLNLKWDDSAGYASKIYCVGINGAKFAGTKADKLPEFVWEEPADGELKTTSLHQLHNDMGAKMVPFAGYDMPVWYSSVSDEHQAVRNHAGIFDVTHMGVFDAKGAGAEAFLDFVTTNDVSKLAVGESHYTYFLGVDGIPLDDLMIYRLAADHFLVVVNASNNDKNWTWLNAVLTGTVQIDPHDTSRRILLDDVQLRDLRNPVVGKERRVDVALQGPKSKDILLAMHGSESDKAKVSQLKWACVAHVTLGGYDLIVSRTGYTGERMAYELFIHPDQSPGLFKDLVEGGAVPCGLAARDSLRTEAGLPLYGHELNGSLGLNPADAGFSTYVKLYKPYFIGKAAFIAHEKERDAMVTRFRLDNKGVRPPHQGDPLVDNKGRVVGIVTSCSIDSEGYQLGQALMKQDYRKVGTQLAIFAGADRAKSSELSGLSLGKKVTVPEPVTVLSRFPKK